MDDTRLTRIENKIDAMHSDLVEVKADVNYHIKRSDTLEEEFKPIRARMLMLEGGLKLLGVLGMLLALYEAIKALK